MTRFGRGFFGRQDLPQPLSGFEQPIPVSVLPSAATGSATGVTGTGATLNGTVNPNGQIDCHYYFQWGTTVSYGNTTASTDAGTGTSNVAASAAITGLTTGQTYHYRVVATNANGIVYGLDQTLVPQVAPAAITAGIGEATVLTGDRYTIRHIGPAAQVAPTVTATQHTVLSNSTMVARTLPASPLPDSPDLVTGSYTSRLGDSGDGTLTFPNTVASDGIPWRQRFDPTGHLQFVEIYYNNELEYAGVIDQIPSIDQTHVEIHSADGWWMLKKAYTRDWVTVQSPRDVIEHGTQVWVPVLADNFQNVSISGTTVSTQTGSWTSSTYGTTATITANPGGGVKLYASPSTPPNQTNADITSPTFTVPATGTWRATATFTNIVLGPGSAAGDDGINLYVYESGSGNGYELGLFSPYNSSGTVAWNGSFFFNGGTLAQSLTSPSATSYTLMLESDGEWVWAFINGQLIGCVRRSQATTTSLYMVCEASASPSTCSAVVTSAMVETLQPFMMRGTDKGDYVLPGTASTYPTGGLHARYFNDLDLQNDTNAPSEILAPTRTNAYIGSGGPEYMNQMDSQINGQSPPAFAATVPGAGPAALPNWSCVWFGAVYLKLSQGNYTFSVTIPASTQGFRLWVGQTQWGQQVMDWFALPVGPGTFSGTVSASTLSGTLPYGTGTSARDGWYSIKLEYAASQHTGAAINAPTLSFTPPVSYTDPGGTSLTGGSSVAIPATSLSPLGCVDQRYQAISHYDLVQQTVQAYGYQAAVEPKQLESGLFPGVLAPRIREGHDTDIRLEPDHMIRTAGEGILNYSSGLDATDFAASLQGNGAGIQNGGTGQLQAMVFDPATMLGSLFDAQQWQDFSDAAFPSLLQALLNSHLGLQLSPWQLLTADPKGRPRNSYTWPLPGSIAVMRWRPGDGLRINAPDINIVDTTPRQILTFTRSILPLGGIAAQASFALRPKTDARILKQQMFKATRWARNYQGQLTTLSAGALATSAGGGGNTTATTLPLFPGDQVLRAYVRVTENTNNVPFTIQTTAGAHSANQYQGIPVQADITGIAQPDSNGNLGVYLHVPGATGSTFTFQAFVDVLR